MRHKHSDYMHWSTTRSRARFNLATSGVAAFPSCELPVGLRQLAINGHNSYGFSAVTAAIAEHRGVDPECVLELADTSMANKLSIAAASQSGDDILTVEPVGRLI